MRQHFASMKVKPIIPYIMILPIILGISLFATIPSLAIKFLVISSLVLLCLPSILTLCGKPIDIFAPVWFFTILYTIGYGYKAALIVFDPQEFVTFPSYFPNDLEFIIYAFFLSLLGLAAFYFGYFTGPYKLMIKFLPSLADNVLAGKRLIFASLFGISIGVITFSILIRSISVDLDWKNVPTILFNVTIRQEIMSQLIGKGFLFFFLTLVPFFALVYIYYVLHKSLRRSIDWIMALLVFTVAMFTMSILGGRMLLMGLLLGTATLYNYCVRRINILVSLTLILTAGWLAGILGVMLSSSYSDYSALSFYSMIKRMSDTFEFFDDFVTALVYVTDFLGGVTILEDFIYTYLPRAIFPWKPLIYGQVRLQEAILPGLYAESGFANTMTMGILAEGYVNFGIVGVLLLPVLLGIFLRGLYEKAQKEGGLYLVIYGFTLGSMLNTLRGFGSYIIASSTLILICWLFYKARLVLPVPRRRNLIRN